MSTEQTYCVAAENYGGEDQGAWFQEPYLGNTSRRSECHEHTASEAIKTIAKDYNRETCRIYRAEDVLADALGIAYVRPGAEPVTLTALAEWARHR